MSRTITGILWVSLYLLVVLPPPTGDRQGLTRDPPGPLAPDTHCSESALPRSRLSPTFACMACRAARSEFAVTTPPPQSAAAERQAAPSPAACRTTRSHKV